MHLPYEIYGSVSKQPNYSYIRYISNRGFFAAQPQVDFPSFLLPRIKSKAMIKYDRKDAQCPEW